MAEVSVVIPARRAADTIGKTIAACQRQLGGVDAEVLVVVHHQDDETAAAVERSCASVAVLRASSDVRGAGGQRNLGVAHATAPILAFTDADCVPAEDWLEQGLLAIADADVVQGAVAPPPGESMGPFDRTVFVERESSLFETANLFVRKDRFLELDGFEDWSGAEERDGRPFGEDAWFGWRARRAGARIKFARSAVVHHLIFRGSPASYIAEHARRRLFPPFVRRVPELRDAFCYRRIFLSRRTAYYDAAALGAALSLIKGRAWPLAATLPYALLLANVARQWGGRDALLAGLAGVAADSVGCGALVYGSVRAGELLL